MKKKLSVIGLVIIFSTYILMISTFFNAYMHEDKETIVAINDYGEANIELIIILITIPICIYHFILTIEKNLNIEKKLLIIGLIIGIFLFFIINNFI